MEVELGIKPIRDMDTKPLEKEAVSQITALLLKYGFKCADLSFDEDGADLFLIKKDERGTDVYWKCLRCQAKGGMYRGIAHMLSYLIAMFEKIFWSLYM